MNRILKKNMFCWLCVCPVCALNIPRADIYGDNIIVQVCNVLAVRLVYLVK